MIFKMGKRSKYFPKEVRETAYEKMLNIWKCKLKQDTVTHLLE